MGLLLHEFSWSTLEGYATELMHDIPGQTRFKLQYRAQEILSVPGVLAKQMAGVRSDARNGLHGLCQTCLVDNKIPSSCQNWQRQRKT